MTTISLLDDLGVYKSSLKKSYDLHRRGDPEQDAKVYPLLERRGDKYTLDEARTLVEICMYFAHHVCVIENPDDFSRIEVWHAQQVENKYEKVEAMLDKLEKAKAVTE